MKMKSQILICNKCKTHIPRLTRMDDMSLPVCPNCKVGQTGKIYEGNAREYGSETKKQRDRVQGLIRDNMREQVDGIGHELDLSKGINKGEALVRSTTHQATVENEARKFQQAMKETNTPVGSNGWDQTFAQHGFPSTNTLIGNARSQYMADTGSQNPMAMLHQRLGKR